jgi:hypothetical protein
MKGSGVTALRSTVASQARSALIAVSVGGFALLAACGGDDAGAPAVGTWVHPEEGTVILEGDGTGEMVQSQGGVPFTWSLEDGNVEFDLDDDPENEPDAVAALDGDELTFRVGDYSGDEPVVFTRE